MFIFFLINLVVLWFVFFLTLQNQRFVILSHKSDITLSSFHVEVKILLHKDGLLTLETLPFEKEIICYNNKLNQQHMPDLNPFYFLYTCFVTGYLRCWPKKIKGKAIEVNKHLNNIIGCKVIFYWFIPVVKIFLAGANEMSSVCSSILHSHR